MRAILAACGAVSMVAVSSAQQAGQPPAGAAPAPSAAISGVVIDAASKRPLAGVTVSLGRDRAVTTMLRPPPAQQTLTDEKGRFVFWPIEAGAGYFVNASALGYFDGGYGRDAAGTGRRITLTDRQWFERADIEMRRPGSISGRVLDEHGDPVVGVMVRVFRQIHVAGRPQLAMGANALSDDRGAYRFGNLLPGRYVVNVPSVQMAAPASLLAPLAAKAAPTPPSALNPPATLDPTLEVEGGHRLVVGRFAVPPASAEGRLLAYPQTWHPGTASVASAGSIDLDHGIDRSGVDVRLQALPTARVSGVVHGPPDVVGGITLRLLPAGTEALGIGVEAATALVGPDGSFTFVNVPSGDYTIDFRGTISTYESDAGSARYNIPLPPGMRSTGSSAMSLDSATPGSGMTTMTFGGERYWIRTPVVVGDKDLANIAVTLQTTISLRGRLVFEGQSAQPSTRFIVAEPANGDASLGQRLNSERTDPSAFEIEGLMPGEYFVRLRGSATWVTKSITAAGRDHTNTPFDTGAGRDIPDIVITLTDRPAAIEGTVTTGDGRPAANALVVVFPADPRMWTGYGLSPDRIKAAPLTNASAYSIRNLPAGEYLAVAVDAALSGSWHDPAFFEAAAASASRVTLSWGAAATQSLRITQVAGR